MSVISAHCDVFVISGLMRLLHGLAADPGRLSPVLQRNVMFVTSSDI